MTATGETCNAVTKEGSKLRICELPLRHDDDHRDGTYSWPQESSRT